MAGLGEPMTSERHLLITERQREAMELRLKGFTILEIAMHFRVSKSTAHGYVMDGMERTLRPAADALRELENGRLDALWKTFFPLALQGDYKAADRCLRISERRALMNGLDLPKKVDVTTGGAPLTAEQSVSLAAFSALSPTEQIAAIRARITGTVPVLPAPEEVRCTDENDCRNS
jgi:hypothetical protein